MTVKDTPWRAEFLEFSGIFAPFATVALPFRDEAAWPTAAAFNRALAHRRLTNAAGLPLVFKEAAPKPRRRRRLSPGAARLDPTTPELDYERRIFVTGEVPTRPASWHDFFNMLVWSLFPLTKAALNERQCTAKAFATDDDLARGQVRTREQDRLAIFDEGGAILVCDAADPSGRPRLQIVFGHAVHELTVKGEAAPTLRLLAATFVRPAEFFDLSLEARAVDLDEELADRVKAGAFAAADQFGSVLLREMTDLLPRPVASS